MLNALEELKRIRGAGQASVSEKPENPPTKPTKASLVSMNADLAFLQERIIKARCHDPKTGTRADALGWLARQIEKLTAPSVEAGGTRDGWPDAGDPFSYGDQLTALRHGLAEVEQGPYPLPLPHDCTLLPQANFDVFAAGRLYNGAVSTSRTLPTTTQEGPHR